MLGPMVQHYASICFRVCLKALLHSQVVRLQRPRGSLKRALQQIRERMEAILKGIHVGSDHWSTVI